MKWLDSPTLRIPSCGPGLLVAALALVSSRPAAAEVVEAKLPSGSVLEFSTPSEWKVDQRSNPFIYEAWFLSTPEAPAAVLHLTAFKLAPESKVHTVEDLRKVVEDQGTSFLPWAAQKRLETLRLELREGVAFYYHLSDRDSKDVGDDFRELHHGAALVSGHFIAFAVSTHAGADSLVEKALGAIASLRISPKSSH